jgi:hypothetical protein
MSVRALATLSALVTAMAATGGVARAEPENYFQKPDDVVFRIDKERTTTDRIVIGSIGGGAVLFGAIGALFTLDYNDKSGQVEASGTHTGIVYSDRLEDTRKSAIRSRNFAIASYSLAGVALIGTIVAYIVTDPGTEEVTYGPGGVIEKKVQSSTLVAPIEGGAMVGRIWSF